jgi:hypothetical protein
VLYPAPQAQAAWDALKALEVLPTPQVPPEVWAALKEVNEDVEKITGRCVE